MEDCKPVTTPMQTSCKLRKDDDSKSINAGSWTGGTISRSTKGITCISSEEDFQISQRKIRVWIMVSKKKGSITYCLHRCRLGRLH
jgi:hypothetical protein